MGKKDKVFDLKGQKETIDSLNGLFSKFVHSERQRAVAKELKLDGHMGNGLQGPGAVADPLSEMLREGARFLLGTAVRCELEEFLKQYEDRLLDNEIYANLVFKDMIKRRPDRLSSPPLFSLLSLRSHL